MKQILLNLKDGTTEVVDIPCPNLSEGGLLIRTVNSLISSGTERMLVDFGQANLAEKAIKKPEQVKRVIDKAKTDGLISTILGVTKELQGPIALGYCNVGHVQECGASVNGFVVGDRVASNGKHAEMVSVPGNLCARIPDNVSDEEAAFTVVSAVALQGLRLMKPTLGERIVVTGLGLIGLLTVQLLQAQGCHVLGLDIRPERLSLARKFGAETVDLSTVGNPLTIANSFSKGQGVDAVIITASTKSNQPIQQGAQMCRKRGRIILVGDVGLDINREDFYEKELSFQVSCSYGPGRYDPSYEEQGKDYPFGFVRWTEQRNFEAVLEMMSNKKLDVMPLISHRFDLEEAPRAYDLLRGSESSLGIILNYKNKSDIEASKVCITTNSKELFPENTLGDSVPNSDYLPLTVSFIGAGKYASSTLIPAFKKRGVNLLRVASRNGVSSTNVGRKYGFLESTTDLESVFFCDKTDVIVIATHHDSHAELVVRALQARKAVFVEKPLCLTLEQLSEINKALFPSTKLMVGFNRRFAPQIQKIKQSITEVGEPKSFIMTVNAGAVPEDHWTQNREIGGGRIVGEACHFVDLLRFLAGVPITQHKLIEMHSNSRDTATIELQFSDGSIGTIHYFSNGSRSFPKERLEVFCGGRVLQLDNFRRLKAYGWPDIKSSRLWRQDKGNAACVSKFLRFTRDLEANPLSLEEILEVSRICIELDC